MRQFVVCGHDAPTTPEFSLDDLAGGAGRLDLLCRCVNAGLFLSHGIREDSRVHLVLGDEYTVRFSGATARGLHPDERTTAARVRDALDARENAIGHMPAEVSPGVELYRMGVAETLDAIDGTLVQLHEEGDPIVETEPPEDPVFVLSDHSDFTAEEADLLADRADRRVRLGPEAIHADHAISVANNYLDTDGYERY
ncbi:tRNA (pseudouridine(54)-N(1))-methyltransferase TrmY [Halobaculum sp. WSA2]|uniref:tRNA (pseudouridine(54)-N(1))-methyltransferase n=1 Tax=Halobaculum saliterrae TaxID=2073113 RepID=A0A6B0SML6_9EURY|nr:tRNA (pseudouridine(54)-N(1))-methyltransferase TrmY [Halobaculum saliterrae]MXR39975.1 tRNA (pseudouridine(54)-N(1))-methyltransferase TrmY [Halobaculum saliterrae]